MAHLSPQELIDLAEGAQPDSSVPHLASCEVCRRELAEVRGLMASVVDIPVPEPSPLFWDHLSARVREAVAAEAPPAARWSIGRLPWGLAAAMGAAVVVIAVSVTIRNTADPTAILPVLVSPAETSGGGERVSMADDPSLSLLGDLAGELDWDAAAEAGMVMAVGAADEALTEMTADERVELQRLLREAMSSGGSS